jgi:catechol 2,3-dioxygenase-like lactoylglutathione lyase family enzyme
MAPDPLDALHLPIVPVEPRPEFADALLRQIRMAEARATGATAGPSAGEGPAEDQTPTPTQAFRYFVDDLDAAVSFYCGQLGFEAEVVSAPAFAMLYRRDLRLLLSVPGAAGAGRPRPDGTVPQPGGWNRIALQVADLAAMVSALRDAGARFQDDIVTGVGVRQAVLQDPAGNLVELFEPIAGYHERAPAQPRPRQEGDRS